MQINFKQFFLGKRYSFVVVLVYIVGSVFVAKGYLFLGFLFFVAASLSQFLIDYFIYKEYQL